jgi:hypothetical protein
MRHTEFWARMEQALGGEYASSWARLTVIGALGSRTVSEALAEGVDPKQVWTAVHQVLELPESDR